MLVRRRYYTWLIKAYVKRWKRTIFYSILAGVVIALTGFAFIDFSLRPLVEKQVQRIGYAGAYTFNTIPSSIIGNISYGLTTVESDGEVKPKAASSWEISDGGKDFIFHIRPHQYFHDGDELTAYNADLNYQDVSKKVINRYTVEYSLSTPYSPFLVAASKPLFLSNTIGLGTYKIKSVDLNAGYIKTLVLQNRYNSMNKKVIYFYPTRDALKTAFALGELDEAVGLKDLSVENVTNFTHWKNVVIQKNTDYGDLVVLFYNNIDGELSNQKFRQALDFALPASFPEGERAFSPIPPDSIYFSKAPSFGIVDMGIAKTYYKSAQASLPHGLEIDTVDELVPVAQIVKKQWEQLGFKVKINTIDSFNDLPANFQVFLYQIKLPEDPDQYTLWHSDQVNNIGHFKNLRIDKLLEDGRVTTDTMKREVIYADFEKYLADDVPASFLYFPYEYTITKR